MKYLGDYSSGSVVYFLFHTVDSTGALSQLSGAFADVYRNDELLQYPGTGTGSGPASGVTISTDHDGITGLNLVTIDLSSDPIYAAGYDYSIVLNSGQVDGVSVAGYVVATFSIENRWNDSAVAAYPDGFVYIHDSAGAAGTTVGINGTISNPSNTAANAVTIANARGIKRLKLLNSIWGPLGGDVAFESVNLTDYIVDLNGSSITLANNVDTSRTTFLNGVIDKKGSETYVSLGGAYGTSCRLTDIVLLSDVQITHSLTATSIPLMERVKFAGSVTFLGNSFAMDAFVNCGNYYYDYTLAGLDNPTVFDANGKKVLLRLPGWYGDAKITNMTNASSIFKFYGYGALTIDATCTGGTVYYTSHISITDNSGGAVTLVPVSSAATDESIADAVWDEMASGHLIVGTFGYYWSRVIAWFTGSRVAPTGTPPRSTDGPTKLDWLYRAFRNKSKATATGKEFYNDAGSVDWYKGVTLSGTAYYEEDDATGTGS